MRNIAIRLMALLAFVLASACAHHETMKDPLGAAVGASPVPYVLINAGGKTSQAFAADVGSIGGWTSGTTNHIRVWQAPPEDIYQTQRVGKAFSYVIPNLFPSTPYVVRLLFAETYWTTTGQRLFNVTMNGTAVLTNFDIVKAAGGANLSLAEAFNVTTTATGAITIGFTAVVDNATVAGIELLPGDNIAPSPLPTTSAAPTPTASAPEPTNTPTLMPTTAPTSVPTTGANAGLPYVLEKSVTSQSQTGNSPFSTSFARMKHLGKLSAVSPTLTANLWNEGLADNGMAQTYGPVYVVSKTINANAPLVTFKTFAYGSNPYSGTKVHLPTWAENQGNSKNIPDGSWDNHLAVIDYLTGIEVEGWECANVNGGGTFTYGSSTTKGVAELDCYYGMAYPIGSNGLSGSQTHPGFNATHTGFAISAMAVTPQEIVNAENGTPISHALGLFTACVARKPAAILWPAYNPNGTDDPSNCTGTYPQEGSLLHLTAAVNTAYSKPCQAIQHALADYGAYIGDTGNNGLQLATLHTAVYSADPTKPVNPWNGIASDMKAAGDADSANGSSANWRSCLQRNKAADFELVTVTKTE
jgi:hypothetical protein